MSQKCKKKLVLLKTYYYRSRTQDGQSLVNATNFVTNNNPMPGIHKQIFQETIMIKPKCGTSSDSSIRSMTDKNFNPIKNKFVEFTTIIIPPNNHISGITEPVLQETVMIKTKCGFVSANTFYFNTSSDTTTMVPIVDYLVTASSGDLKDAVKVIIEFDNDGTRFSNGIKFARRVRVYACK